MPAGSTRLIRTRPVPSGVAPRKAYSISLVVSSPKNTIRGGRLGLFGLPELLSYTASTSIRVPAFAVIGVLNQYVSCQL